jgi:uncharacterized membrane protein
MFSNAPLRSAGSLAAARSLSPRGFAHCCLVFLFVVALSATVLACPICFQTDDGHVVSGVRAGVAVMMTVTVGVLIAAGVFAHRVARRQ